MRLHLFVSAYYNPIISFAYVLVNSFYVSDYNSGNPTKQVVKFYSILL